MQMTALMAGFYRISEWIMRFAYLNLLWIGFSLFGLIAFGFFPATAAMYAVNRKWVMGEWDIPVFKTFYTAYKTEFVKSNLLGLILVLMGCILYADYLFFMQTLNRFEKLLSILFLALFLIYSLLLFYVFPVFAHFNITIYQVIKRSLLLMFLNPLSSITMIIGSIVVYLTAVTFPALLPIFGASILSYIFTWSAHYNFEKNQRKKEAFNKVD